MKHLILAVLAASLLGLGPVRAQDASITIDHISIRERALFVLESQFGTFKQAAHDLAEASQSFCAGALDADEFIQVFEHAWLAWAPLDIYQFGPVEQTGAALIIGFYPDKKDFVGRGLKALLALPEDSLSDAETITIGSAAAQGLPAIERLLFSDMPECPAVIGISANIRNMSDTLYDGWFAPKGWAELARSPGPDNPVYLTEAEFTKALHSAVNFGLSRIADTRLGRPLGTYARTNPTQAEARRSGLSLAIIDAQLAGIARLVNEVLAYDFFNNGPYRLSSEIQITREQIASFDAPLDKLVAADPMTRFRVESLQNRVLRHKHKFDEAIENEAGMSAGFTAADGD